MRIKKADDKSKRLTLLESLLSDKRVNAEGQKWLDKELWALRTGIQGEKDAAHYLDTYFDTNSQNTVLLHDLRVEVDGQVAQIDHLLINRLFEFILIESKNFSGNLIINERNEFSVAYGSKAVGIPSPFEQSKRHALVLDALRKKLGIVGRLGANPTFTHVVLVHPQTTITRPNNWKPPGHLMKADAFATWYQQEHVEEASLLSMVKEMTNVRSRETVREWGNALLQAHQPAALFQIPDFIERQLTANAALRVTPSEVAVTAAQSASPAAVHNSAFATVAIKTLEGGKPFIKTSGYFCAKCKTGISQTVYSFCMNNKNRFAGRAYCMPHQKDF